LLSILPEKDRSIPVRLWAARHPCRLPAKGGAGLPLNLYGREARAKPITAFSPERRRAGIEHRGAELFWRRPGAGATGRVSSEKFSFLRSNIFVPHALAVNARTA
jgi:hypothetical protein